MNDLPKTYTAQLVDFYDRRRFEAQRFDNKQKESLT
jgi:hypothetical protein